VILRTWWGGALTGDPEQLVTGLAGIREAVPGDVSFVASPKYQPAVKTTRASVLIVAPDMDVAFGGALIRVDNPSEAFVRLAAQVAPRAVSFRPGAHPTAIIAPTARLGKEVSIQPHAVIEDGAIIGDRTIIGAGSYIGHESRLGRIVCCTPVSVCGSVRSSATA